MEGYEVTTAADGQEVMEALQRRGADGRPDVILLDAMMPRKSGLDVLRELREADIETPVLIVSAHQEEEAADGASGLEGERLHPQADRLRRAARADRRADGGRRVSRPSCARPRGGSPAP